MLTRGAQQQEVHAVICYICFSVFGEQLELFNEKHQFYAEILEHCIFGDLSHKNSFAGGGVG